MCAVMSGGGGDKGAAPKRYGALSLGPFAYALLKLASGQTLPLQHSLRNRKALERESFSVERLVVVVVPDQAGGEALLRELRFLFGESRSVRSFFSWEVLPFDGLSPTEGVSGARLRTLFSLLKNEPGVVVVSADVLPHLLFPCDELRSSARTLRVGEAIGREEIVAVLDSRGYVRTNLVEEIGQLAVRGAVVDFFPPSLSSPVRVELFGDEIEAIRLFEGGTQRSFAALEEVEIIPAREILFPWLLNEERAGELSEALSRLRARAAELEIPLRAIEPIEEALRVGAPWPGLEHLQPFVRRGSSTFFEYVPKDAVVVLSDELAIQNALEEGDELLVERSRYAHSQAIVFPPVPLAFQQSETALRELLSRTAYHFDPLQLLDFSNEEEVGETPRVQILSNGELTRSLQRAKHEELPLKPLGDEISKRLEEGYRVAYVVENQVRGKRINEILQPYGVSFESFGGSFLDWLESGPSRVLLEGSATSGFVAPSERVQLIAESEIFPESGGRRKAPAVQKTRRFLGALNQIRENDYVVHVEHGVGIYRGLKEIAVEGKVGDYLVLEYAEEAKLFLPVENIGKLQKYVGGEGVKPPLTKLGGKSWVKTKEKVKERIQELAGELINLYAEREVAHRPSFGGESEEDRNFATTFPFQETPDQEKAIADVFRDMERAQPMDRLVCGDVGYGKTEVALRAAFKAVSNGKQVAFLVPTTILAEQHFATVKERFRDFAVSAGCVSRFFTTQENRDTLAKLASGKIDVIVGTHRLLQKDVLFRDLGLVIVDEEHKFGVKDKERLKRLRKDVDVLTLTATPIPRTLHMSLLDIRDLSVIETPPHDRQVIRTYVAPYQDGVVREAILRELARGGQVFYIHNRVRNIALIADELADLIPEAKITFGHGQMKEQELEEVMHRFISGEVNVLVSTTIVESGLDIPNANTIIIREADKLGLAELYQLRGRVGRSSRRAYAYLMVSDPKTLGSDAKRRLEVLQSLDDLGQGFRLALQDMEIRGAGNLLGKDQSGHIELVGFELYSKILKETVLELRRRQRGEVGGDRPVVDPEITVGFPAHIPKHFVPDVEERLILYQRLVDLRDQSEADEMAIEIEDRFGQLPPEVVTLLQSMVFRAYMRSLAVTAATYRGGVLSLSFHPEAFSDPAKLLAIVSRHREHLKLSPAMVLSIHLPASQVESPKDLLRAVKGFLNDLEPGR